MTQDNKQKSRNTKIRNDIILILSILLLLAVVFSLYFIFAKNGEYVCVYVNGELYAKYSLDEDREEKITSKDPSGAATENILVIKDGKAKISSANCPDKRCANTAAQYRAGGEIICVPNRVVVSIE